MDRGNNLLQSQRAMPADNKHPSGSVSSSRKTDEWIKRTAAVLEDLRRLDGKIDVMYSWGAQPTTVKS